MHGFFPDRKAVYAAALLIMAFGAQCGRGLARCRKLCKVGDHALIDTLRQFLLIIR